jgi:ArsR family transcriptional regulator
LRRFENAGHYGVMAGAKPQVGPVEQCRTPMTAEPLSAGAAADLAKVFKALSDPIRLRLLSLIASHADGEACVCDLTGKFDVTAPTISFHLKVLREAGLVRAERRRTWVYYRVDQPVLRQLESFFGAGRPGEALLSTEPVS